MYSWYGGTIGIEKDVNSWNLPSTEASAGSAADAVDVLLQCVGHVYVDDLGMSSLRHNRKADTCS